MERIEVKLKRARGSITTAIVDFEENDEGFRAEICYPRGSYSEVQTTTKGSIDIDCLFQWDEENGIRNIDAGQITHREPITDIESWGRWLVEYVSTLDPRDAFRAYRDTVGF
jgi:hypothetical protein